MLKNVHSLYCSNCISGVKSVLSIATSQGQIAKNSPTFFIFYALTCKCPVSPNHLMHFLGKCGICRRFQSYWMGCYSMLPIRICDRWSNCRTLSCSNLFNRCSAFTCWVSCFWWQNGYWNLRNSEHPGKFLTTMDNEVWGCNCTQLVISTWDSQTFFCTCVLLFGLIMT